MIPGTAHFIWFGASLPWASVLAIRSALRWGGFERAVLHHEAGLEQTSGVAELLTLPGLECRVIDAPALLGSIGPAGASLFEVYQELSLPAARANVLRAAILLREGGVYLDADTLTVRSLTPLRESCSAFVGEERIALPFTVRASKNPWTFGLAVARRSLRDVFRRIPSGWRGFRTVERFYPSAANNAVLGAEPQHPLLVSLTQAMLELEPSARTRRFSLGTHLLQKVVAAAPQPLTFRRLAPAYFYPLGPEISEHWFRLRPQLPPLGEVLLPETLVVHWYASVRTKHIVPLIDRAYIEQHRHDQLFSALAVQTLEAAELELA